MSELDGAVLDAVDEGALDTGAEDVDTSEAETLGDEPETEEPEEGEETEGDEETDEPVEEDPAAVAADGRKMPDGIKKALASIKATDPATAKILKSTYFENQEWRAAMGTPTEALAVKDLIESVGGKEGIDSIQAEREEWNQIDQGFAEGKKEFVTGLADGNPEAFLKTAPHVINEFAARAPEQYQYYANSVASNTVMQQPGMEAGLQALSQLHGQLADAPWAQQAIASVVNGIVGLKEKASQFEQKQTEKNPREEALNEREKQFETSRRADFETRVENRSFAFLTEKMKPAIESVLAGRKVSSEAMGVYQNMVKEKVALMLGAIPGFESSLEAHYRTGDPQKSVDFVNKYYARLLPEAAKVIAPLVRDIKASPAVREKATSAGARPAAAGEVVLKEMPDREQIDFSKCSVADVISGKAVLLNGKNARGWA
jgi:hypothetical protein